jgi:hypothetical protein
VKNLNIMTSFAIQVAPTLGVPLSVSGGTIQIFEGSGASSVFDTEDPSTISPNESNKYIQTDQNITIRVQWSLSGILNMFMMASYTCTAYFELMGTNNATTDFTPLAPTSHILPVPNLPATVVPYLVDIPVAAGSLAPGIYHLVVSLTTKVPTSGSGGIGFPLVGFVDMGCIQVYEA